MKIEVRKAVSFVQAPTAAEWGLYEPDSPGAAAVAERLNEAFQELVNEGFDRTRVWTDMQVLMRAYDAFGAYDSEPRRFLNTLLDSVFGE